MTKLLALLAVDLCLGISGFLFATLGDAADDVTIQREAVVTIAVARPPQPAPVVDSTGSLPAIAPIPDRAPAISRIEPANDAIQQAEPTGSGEAIVIQVTARPSPVFSGPSSSAIILYGFPAGRPLRVISHDAGFAQIEDLKSGARGWIDDRALASTMRTASVNPESKPAKPNRQPGASVESGPKPAKGNRQAAVEIEAPATSAAAPARKRMRRGLFGGVKSDDGRDSGFPGFLQRAFGAR